MCSRGCGSGGSFLCLLAVAALRSPSTRGLIRNDLPLRGLDCAVRLNSFCFSPGLDAEPRTPLFENAVSASEIAMPQWRGLYFARPIGFARFAPYPLLRKAMEVFAIQHPSIGSLDHALRRH